MGENKTWVIIISIRKEVVGSIQAVVGKNIFELNLKMVSKKI